MILEVIVVSLQKARLAQVGNHIAGIPSDDGQFDGIAGFESGSRRFSGNGVDISVPQLVRTVRRFIDEEERAGEGSPAPRRPASDSSVTKERHPESAAVEGTKPKAPVTYQLSEQPSSRVQEEEFAKQLRLARYLAASSLPPSRTLESAPEAKTPKRGRPVAKPGAKAKAETGGKKAREEELAKERRRTRQAVQHKTPSSRRHPSERSGIHLAIEDNSTTRAGMEYR